MRMRTALWVNQPIHFFSVGVDQSYGDFFRHQVDRLRGDSLIEGIGATNGNDLVSDLSKKIAQPIVNLGVSGNTTADGLARIDAVIEMKPQIVIVLLGGNDYLKKVPKEQTFKNLETIVTKLQESGSIVLLLGVQGGIFSDQFESLFKDLAKRKGVGYVSNVLDGLVTHSEYMSDAVHPNDIGYAKIADRVYPVLKSLLK